MSDELHLDPHPKLQVILIDIDTGAAYPASAARGSQCQCHRYNSTYLLLTLKADMVGSSMSVGSTPGLSLQCLLLAFAERKPSLVYGSTAGAALTYV